MVSIGSENAKNIQYCKPIFFSLIADLFHHFNQGPYSRMHEDQTFALQAGLQVKKVAYVLEEFARAWQGQNYIGSSRSI